MAAASRRVGISCHERISFYGGRCFALAITLSSSTGDAENAKKRDQIFCSQRRLVQTNYCPDGAQLLRSLLIGSLRFSNQNYECTEAFLVADPVLTTRVGASDDR